MIDMANVLKILRKKAGISQAKLAEASGYSAEAVSLLETNTRGGYNSFAAFLDVLGYELKIVPKGMFKSDIIEFTKELPKTMHPDPNADEGLVIEFGRPLVSDDEYLIVDEMGKLYSSRLYLFEDGKIEGDGYNYENPVAWIEMPKYEGNQ